MHGDKVVICVGESPLSIDGHRVAWKQWPHCCDCLITIQVFVNVRIEMMEEYFFQTSFGESVTMWGCEKQLMGINIRTFKSTNLSPAAHLERIFIIK